MTDSRNKGKRGEREAAAALARVLGCEARRGVQYHGGPDSPDVITDIEGVHWEVKRSERLRLYDAVGQAEAEAGNAVPVVLHRANCREWVVIVELARLPELVAKIGEYTEAVKAVVAGAREMRSAR